MMLWFTPISLGHLPRPQRARLCAALQGAIYADQRDHGAAGPLALLGTALGYCGSLLSAVPVDPDGDAVDLALARLGDELRLGLQGLQAGVLRGEDAALRGAARAVLQRLLPPGGPDEPLVLARALLLLAGRLARPTVFTHLALEPGLERLRATLRALELAQARCAAAAVLGSDGEPLPGMHLETALRARQATRFGDALIRRLVGYAQALEDPDLGGAERGAAPGLRERALRLLRPLWDLSLAGAEEPGDPLPSDGGAGLPLTPHASPAPIDQADAPGAARWGRAC